MTSRVLCFASACGFAVAFAIRGDAPNAGLFAAAAAFFFVRVVDRIVDRLDKWTD